MSYAKYESYKDSGVDWLGEIPSDWELISLNRVSKVKSISNHPNERLLSVYLEKGVIPFEDVSEKRTNGTSDNLDKYQLVDIGDFVLNNQQAWRGSVGVSNYRGIISPAYIILEISDKLNSKFANYFFRSEKMIYQYVIHSKGVGTIQRNLYWQSFKNSLCWIPSLEEQTKIANFLDQKTAQIDQAIALKQQQIEKLSEYKQIVIQNAVTKGLNPNAPMKDSGVEWIGDIPEHWDVIRFRNAFRFNKGLNITKENLNDEQGILCLNYGEIHSKYGFEFIPNVHPLKFVDESYLKNNQKSLLNDGDFVFADTSEDIEGSGNFSYINGQDLVFAGYHTLIAKPKINFNSRFIAYVLDSSAFRNQVRLRVKGVKVFSITQAILKTTFIWLPTEQEQNEIVKYLDEKMQKFNNAKIAYQIQIDRLKEYKNILINQAVTGKIKI